VIIDRSSSKIGGVRWSPSSPGSSSSSSSSSSTRGPGRPAQGTGSDTRDRILESALDLFSEHGYDKTSLREIADQVKVTKAALYYYFPSKQEILGALADRLFDSAETGFDKMERKGFDMTTWRDALSGLVDRLLAQQKVVTLLERNRTVFEHLHENNEERFASHVRMHAFVDSVVRDPSVPLDERVRCACSIGAVIAVVLGTHDGFADVSADELRPVVLDALRDLLRVEH
jgi:AcrR family transcriptional regulator